MKESYLSEKYLNGYQEASRVIIAGGRDFDDYKYMSSKLTELFENSAYFKGITIKIISGMAIPLPSVMQMNINWRKFFSLQIGKHILV